MDIPILYFLLKNFKIFTDYSNFVFKRLEFSFGIFNIILIKANYNNDIKTK